MDKNKKKELMGLPAEDVIHQLLAVPDNHGKLGVLCDFLDEVFKDKKTGEDLKMQFIKYLEKRM